VSQWITGHLRKKISRTGLWSVPFWLSLWLRSVDKPRLSWIFSLQRWNNTTNSGRLVEDLLADRLRLWRWLWRGRLDEWRLRLDPQVRFSRWLRRDATIRRSRGSFSTWSSIGVMTCLGSEVCRLLLDRIIIGQHFAGIKSFSEVVRPSLPIVDGWKLWQFTVVVTAVVVVVGRLLLALEVVAVEHGRPRQLAIARRRAQLVAAGRSRGGSSEVKKEVLLWNFLFSFHLSRRTCCRKKMSKIVIS